MKILISAGKSLDDKSIMLGWFNALSALGYECLRWDTEDKKPVFDVFDDFKPDLVVINSNELSRASAKLLSFDGIKKIVFLSNYKDATDDEKEHVEKVLNNGTPGFSRNFKDYLQETHWDWKHQTLSCLPAADITRFKPGNINKKFKCDINFIGTYKEANKSIYNKFLFPLLSNNYIKIYGYGFWPTPYHVGSITDNVSFRDAITNAGINLSMSDEIGYSPSERIYKVLACGGVCVAHNVNHCYKREFAPAGPGLFSSIQDINDYLRNCFMKEVRDSLAKTGMDYIEKGNTYFHRVFNVFQHLAINTDKLEEFNGKIGYSLK